MISVNEFPVPFKFFVAFLARKPNLRPNLNPNESLLRSRETKPRLIAGCAKAIRIEIKIRSGYPKSR